MKFYDWAEELFAWIEGLLPADNLSEIYHKLN